MFGQRKAGKYFKKRIDYSSAAGYTELSSRAEHRQPPRSADKPGPYLMGAGQNHKQMFLHIFLGKAKYYITILSK
jgi:hypothetical protein